MKDQTTIYYADGTKFDSLCKSISEYCDAIDCDIKAVYVDHHGLNKLNSELGAEISIDLGVDGTYMADKLYSEYWCTPVFGKLGHYDVIDNIQYLVYKRDNGIFGVIVPVVSDDYKCILHGESDKLYARLFSWVDGFTDCECLAYVTAEGRDPFKLTKECVAYAQRGLGRENTLVDRKCYPDVFEYLGWCSWDAMPIAVNEAGVVAKCEELKNKNIPVKWAILDDMWAEVTEFNGDILNDLGAMFKIHHATHLYDYEAAYARFPEGLKGVIEKIHQYGMKVGVWHPTAGYWSGLDKNGAAYQHLKDYTYTTKDGKIVGAWDETRAFGYYHTMHDFFRRCGADFLKVDYQSTTQRFYKGAASVGNVARSWHAGLEASVGLHFNNIMINCMGMASEDMWNRSYSSISRCSDDGEPSGTAGRPILDVIIGSGIHNVMVVVSRYFGGTLLGTAGLARTYAAAARAAIEEAGFAVYEKFTVVMIEVGYSEYQKLTVLLKNEGIAEEDTDFGEFVTVSCAMQDEKLDKVETAVRDMTGGRGKFERICVEERLRPLEIKK